MSLLPLTIFVGDTTSDLSVAAQEFDPAAYIIDSSNVTNKHKGTVYVSIGDLSSTYEFFDLLSTASKIIYAPPAVWSDKKTNNDPYSAAWVTEHYIRLVGNLYNIPTENIPAKATGVDDPKPRRSPNQQIWVAGCSTTFGVGVKKDQRYQDIVSRSLGLAVTNLSCPGSSISWSRDQILKSDVKEDDIVIWGITSKNRFPWFNNVKIEHVNVMYYSTNPDFNKTVPVSLLDSPHRLYEGLSAIHQVNNFCTKIGAHLILANIHGDLDIAANCSKYKGFVMMHGKGGLNWDSNFLDYGDDQMHPGKKTHQHYANLILEKINNLNIGINK